MLVAMVVGIAFVPGAALSGMPSASASDSSIASSSATMTSHVTTGLDDYEYESLTAEYYLARDAQGHATLSVVETWVVLFPTFDQNRGIIRAIPNYYNGVPLHTRITSVVDERGASVPYETNLVEGFVELALGDDSFVRGRTTYVISYTQENVVRAFTDTDSDEFYWDVNGTGHVVPFGAVTAKVRIDASLTEFLTGNSACYHGAERSDGTCVITHISGADGDVFTASARNLQAGETLTVAIGFDYGTFVQVPPEFDPNLGAPPPPPPPPTPWWVNAGGVVITLFALLGSLFTIVWRFIKPPESQGRGIIIPQYTVPKGLNLLESADIIGRSGSGVSAQIVSFAVRGKLRILDYPVTKKGGKYTLQLLDTTGLDDQELSLLSALFAAKGGIGSTAMGILRNLSIFGDSLLGQIQEQTNALTIGAVREVGVIDDSAARAVGSVQSGIRARVIERGFKTKRSSAAGFLLAFLMFVLGFAAVALAATAAWTSSFSGWAALAPFACMFGAFVTAMFAYRPPTVTAVGAEMRDYLLGMRDYLQLAEAERFKMLQSPEGALRVRAEGIDPTNPAQKVKLYEKLLPFAVLWGVEKEWAKELTILYSDTGPDWFVSAGTFNMVSFSNAMNTISRNAIVKSTASTSSGSSWSGSSGGSFSGGSRGGGFSGGGGGGGGSRGR